MAEWYGYKVHSADKERTRLLRSRWGTGWFLELLKKASEVTTSESCGFCSASPLTENMVRAVEKESQRSWEVGDIHKITGCTWGHFDSLALSDSSRTSHMHVDSGLSSFMKEIGEDRTWCTWWPLRAWQVLEEFEQKFDVMWSRRALRFWNFEGGWSFQASDSNSTQ